jgi:CBS domain-containing protein
LLRGKEVVGIISRTDNINRLTFGALFEGQEGTDEAILDMLTISRVMTSKPKTVSSDTIIRDWLKFLLKKIFMLYLLLTMVNYKES